MATEGVAPAAAAHGLISEIQRIFSLEESGVMNKIQDLRSKYSSLCGEDPLPIKSTVGMVLDGVTVTMIIPGEHILYFELFHDLT